MKTWTRERTELLRTMARQAEDLMVMPHFAPELFLDAADAIEELAEQVFYAMSPDGNEPRTRQKIRCDIAEIL